MHHTDILSTTNLTYLMIYDVWVIWTSSQTPGRSHPLAGQRVALTPGGVEVMTDGRAVMLGARGRGLGGSRRPCSLPSTGRVCALLMLLPRGRRGGGRGGGLKGACGKWMHRGSLPFCHQTMGLWRMGGTQYDQSSVDQVWRCHSIVFEFVCFFTRESFLLFFFVWL